MEGLRKAVVTGPTGVVGTSLIEELVSNGVSVVAVCNPSSLRIDNVPSSELVEIILCAAEDYDELPSLILPQKVDAFFHLAWAGTHGASRQEYCAQSKNVGFAVSAAMAASKLGASVFVGVGSQAEYGPVEGVLRPDTICNPDTAYGAAKLSAMHMTKAYCGTVHMRHEWCRVLSLYGPKDGQHTLISQLVNGLLDGRHVSCTRGEQLWDYLYSKDAACALRLVAERGLDGAVYCLGSGQARSLKDYIRDIETIVGGGSVGLGEIDYYPNQVMHLEADIGNLFADTGFVPAYSFDRGMSETIDWYRAQRCCD